MDHAAELQIDVDNDLFAPDSNSVRAAVHGNCDMIQLSIPRIYLQGHPCSGGTSYGTLWPPSNLGELDITLS